VGVSPVGHVEGTDFLVHSLSSPTLFLPRSLVLAAVLVVVTGTRVAPGAIACDAEGALAAGTTTWILSGRGNAAADQIRSRKQHPARIRNLSIGGAYLGFMAKDVHGRP
jgi:hypothetical protein